MGEIWLFRHGATEWSVDGRHTGRSDIPLTEHGEAQARALLPIVAAQTFARVLVSPLQRAVSTAQLAGFRTTETAPDAMEWDYGGYDGRSTAQIRREQPGWDVWRDGVIAGATPGETVEQVGGRADRLIATLLPDVTETSATVAIVGHGHFSRIFIARWLELPAVAGSRFAAETASIAICGFERERRVLRGLNLRPGP